MKPSSDLLYSRGGAELPGGQAKKNILSFIFKLNSISSFSPSLFLLFSPLMKVVIASKNPVKKLAVETVFKDAFPGQEIEYECVSAPSEVSDQPKSDEETLRGARNRVFNAQKLSPVADYWVSIEGGIEEAQPGRWYGIAWVAVSAASSKDKYSASRSASFPLPTELSGRASESGSELGSACDEFFKRKDTKQDMGSVGLLTGGAIPRGKLCSIAVHMALIPFINPGLHFVLVPF